MYVGILLFGAFRDAVNVLLCVALFVRPADVIWARAIGCIHGHASVLPREALFVYPKDVVWDFSYLMHFAESLLFDLVRA